MSTDNPLFRAPETVGKTCNKCGVSKPLDAFYALKGMKDGYRNDCKECLLRGHKERYRRDPQTAVRKAQEWRRNNPDRYQAWLKENRTKNRERRRVQSRSGHLSRKYGLTLDDYDFLVAVQGGVCAICGKPDEKGLHIDHEHETGLVRGLLCGRCNKGIGLFEEDPARLDSAKTYLGRKQLPLACGDRRRAAK